ncbi:MAG TPA: long-chain fatty acid--CoA ligase [Acidimicrobiales bacterium]|jgi:long-chain acyl-CoA synthetase|nr:long-chain fatty acid--CoA ligase [Acidimicrobiales bacterium]
MTSLLTRRTEIVTEPAPIEPASTIVDLFWDRVHRAPARPALRFHTGEGWQSVTWADYGRAVAEVAAGLMHLGVDHGDRVAVLATNQVRWHEADIGILSAGATSVPAYPTSASGQLAYVLRHSGARICFVGDRDQLAKVLLRRHGLPTLEHVVVFGDVPDGLDDDFVLTFDDLCSLGRDKLAAEPEVVLQRTREIDAEAAATIVYTSGTTGPPKGAVLTYGNLTATIAGITKVISISPEDRFISFLPLSHIAERTTSHFGQIVAGGETWFARSLSTIAEDLRDCRPTIFFAVPRVWEKFRDAILGQLDAAPGPVRVLGHRYLEMAAHRTAAVRAGTRQRLGERLAYLLGDRVVGTNIRRQLGLDRARILVSGAAPIDPDLLLWFHGIGLPVAEVYGQTEDCGPTSINPPGRIHVGTVGLPLPGLEVRIAGDGEILARGPSVCAGYYLDPDRTHDLIDDDGWMHSGDLGRIDTDGYVHVTGRKKDLIITSSGKNIAPQELETRLRSQPLVSQAVVIGDGRSYLTALLALDSESTAHWGEAHDKAGGFEALRDDPDLRAELAESVAGVNAGHAPIEQIKTWRIIPRELTVAGGELTPTLKVKRDVVAARFGDLIEEMYAQTG